MAKKTIPFPINLSNETYAGPMLPQTWQVIYQEGVRGNHLLFSSEDLRQFASRKHSLKLADDAAENHVVDMAMRLMESHSLGDIKHQISHLSHSQKYYVFQLYQRFINHWNAYSLAQMN